MRSEACKGYKNKSVHKAHSALYTDTPNISSTSDLSVHGIFLFKSSSDYVINKLSDLDML